MTFPTSPVNGQQYLSPNRTKYVYNITNGTWDKVVSGSLGGSDKLTLKMNRASVTTVEISSGASVSSDAGILMQNNSTITIDITTSGVNGLDTGSEAANTWYYIWMIRNGTTNAVAGLFSTSSSAPTVPSGYADKRLIGAVRNDGSSNFVDFHQTDKQVTCANQSVFNVDLSNTYTAYSMTAVAPTNITRSFNLKTFARATGSQLIAQTLVAPTSTGLLGVSSSGTRAALGGSVTDDWGDIQSMINLDGNIYARAGDTGSSIQNNVELSGYELTI